MPNYGFTGPGSPELTTPTFRYETIVEGMTPEEIQAAYESTYGSILASPESFRVSPTAVADYYNRLEQKLTGEGLESIGGELAERGYAPGGGTFGQLYGQLRQNIGLGRAGAELGLEQEAVGRRSAFARQGAVARYAALANRRKKTTQTQYGRGGVDVKPGTGWAGYGGGGGGDWWGRTPAPSAPGGSVGFAAPGAGTGRGIFGLDGNTYSTIYPSPTVPTWEEW